MVSHPHLSTVGRSVAQAGMLAGIAGLTTIAGAYVHARKYVMRTRTVTLSNAHGLSDISAMCETYGPHDAARTTSAALKVLHFSDFHALAANKKLLSFISNLRSADPDFLILTGDLIAQDAAIPEILKALEPFAGIPGVFVFGSNDYYAPVLKNPLRYLFHNSNEKLSEHEHAHRNPDQRLLNTDLLRDGLKNLGFVDLNNARHNVRIGNIWVEAVGVDDPHLAYDAYPAPICAEPRISEPCVRIGVTHAPYSRILDLMHRDRCAIVFAGHTHGGQVCLPGHRALVTNCDLPPRLASGMFVWPTTDANVIKADGMLDVPPEQMCVQLSAGLGTTPFVPLRTWCAPEAIEVTLKLS